MSVNAVNGTASNAVAEPHKTAFKQEEPVSIMEFDAGKANKTIDVDLVSTDGNDDGKLSAGEVAKLAVKGAGEDTKNALLSPLGIAGMIGVTALAICPVTAPFVAPLAVAGAAIGVGAGAIKTVSGVGKMITADTDAEAKTGAKQTGSGAYTTATSAFALKAGLKQMSKVEGSHMEAAYRDGTSKTKAYFEDVRELAGNKFGNLTTTIKNKFGKGDTGSGEVKIVEDPDGQLRWELSDDAAAAKSGTGITEDGDGQLKLNLGDEPATTPVSDSAPIEGQMTFDDFIQQVDTPIEGQTSLFDGGTTAPAPSVAPAPAAPTTSAAQNATASTSGTPKVGDNPEVLDALFQEALKQLGPEPAPVPAPAPAPAPAMPTSTQQTPMGKVNLQLSEMFCKQSAKLNQFQIEVLLSSGEQATTGEFGSYAEIISTLESGAKAANDVETLNALPEVIKTLQQLGLM